MEDRMVFRALLPGCLLDQSDDLPDSKPAGARLVGMAPEDHDHAQDRGSRNDIDIEILSDKGHVVSEQPGPVFSRVEELRPVCLPRRHA